MVLILDAMEDQTKGVIETAEARSYFQGGSAVARLSSSGNLDASLR